MYQFIVNPSAGTGRGYRIWKRLERQLENEGQEYRVFFTKNQGDAAEIAKALAAEKEEPRIVVVVGGEGTFNEVLNGSSFKEMLTLGYVPAGFRNALSKGFQSYRKVNGQCSRILHPKYYEFLDYGVITCGDEEIFSRRFAGRCGIGLDAAICHNLLCSPMTDRMCRVHLFKPFNMAIGLKQLSLARPVKGYLILDGMKKVEFSHIYFVTFRVGKVKTKRKRGQETAEDNGKLTVYVASSSRKRRMIPILMNVLAGTRKKVPGVRIFECTEASLHLERPLPVCVDGESCMCQQDMEIRCIPKRIRMISS